MSLPHSMSTLLVSTSNNSGISLESLKQIKELKTMRKQLEELAGDDCFPTVKYMACDSPWKQVGHVDLTPPCATQNEMSRGEAAALVAAGC